MMIRVHLAFSRLYILILSMSVLSQFINTKRRTCPKYQNPPVLIRNDVHGLYEQFTIGDEVKISLCLYVIDIHWRFIVNTTVSHCNSHPINKIINHETDFNQTSVLCKLLTISGI